MRTWMISFCVILVGAGEPSSVAGQEPPIPLDFSSSGYRQSLEPLPVVPAVLVVGPGPGDDTARIQEALHAVGRRPLDHEGYRGALLLEPGTYEIEGQLVMPASGVVLRGAGMDEETGSVLKATGQDRRPLVRILGVGDREVDEPRQVTEETVPVGASALQVTSAEGWSVGQDLLVTRPSTEAWIQTLGMDRSGVGWRPGSRDVTWERRVIGLEGDRVLLDAPLTTALEARFGGGRAATFRWPGRIGNVGVENLRFESVGSSSRARDEEHAWVGITLENVRDAWVRRITFRGFAGAAVMLWESSKNITVRDCLSEAPISEIGGHRRQTYFTSGEQTLFFRCWSEQGLNDFAVGHAAAGPNAFVECETSESLGDSGPTGSWASGILYDNVKLDGAGLRLENRWVRDHGSGWAAANCVVWQTSAAEFHLEDPPTATNWAHGIWGPVFGRAQVSGEDTFAKPVSLFQAQLAQRSVAAAEALGTIGYPHFGATNPSAEEAAKLASEAMVPQSTLRDRILDDAAKNPLPWDGEGVPRWGQPPEDLAASEEEGESRATADPSGLASSAPSPSGGGLVVRGGRLLLQGKLVTGGRWAVPWWRGNTRPEEAPGMGAAVTRFVPGRIGPGYTDDLEEVTRMMMSTGTVALEHHHGLWYDRRRDDHLRVRRADGRVSPPFYEQPFARSGEGKAWDGLSLYDLETPNPWYWQRLQDFAELASRRGLMLYHQHYFQHALLEAGAHWADFPWRSANNINDTGFPEPPPYASDKRIFQAHLFYDVTHPVRRRLHEQYIRQCLESFDPGDHVIHFTSAEYSGPLSFVQFWIDTAMRWQEETKRTVHLALSAPKDVQDAILEDPARRDAISLIDIRYWHLQADGRWYAPPGGKHLSPRQHARRLKPRPSSFASIVKALREYGQRYPEKALLYHAGLLSPGGNDGWAVLLGGGSVPDLPALPEALAQVLPLMEPKEIPDEEGGNAFCIGNERTGYLLAGQEPIDLALASHLPTTNPATARWIHPDTGELTDLPSRVLWVDVSPR